MKYRLNENRTNLYLSLRFFLNPSLFFFTLIPHKKCNHFARTVFISFDDWKLFYSMLVVAAMCALMKIFVVLTDKILETEVKLDNEELMWILTKLDDNKKNSSKKCQLDIFRPNIIFHIFPADFKFILNWHKFYSSHTQELLFSQELFISSDTSCWGLETSQMFIYVYSNLSFYLEFLMGLICLKNNFPHIEFDSLSDFVCLYFSHSCFHTSSAFLDFHPACKEWWKMF